MRSPRLVFEGAGVLVSTTIGAGVFALPYLFVQAGWLVGFAMLGTLGALLGFVHPLYARVLEGSGGREHLVRLAREHLGGLGYAASAISVIGGLLIALVAYLILAPGFFRLLVPGVPDGIIIALFWFLGSVPLFREFGFFVDAELLGAVVMTALILGLFAASPASLTAFSGEAVTGRGLAPLFGAVLFALGAWTAVPPMLRLSAHAHRAMHRAMIWGSALVVLLYGLFVLGVIGATPLPARDTISDLSGFPEVAALAAGALGLFALWTSYVPIAVEVRDSLVRDFRTRRTAASLVALGAPPLFLLSGLSDFSDVITLGGGVFTAAQYVIIALVALHALRLSGILRFAADAVIGLFGLAALYELYSFVFLT